MLLHCTCLICVGFLTNSVVIKFSFKNNINLCVPWSGVRLPVLWELTHHAAAHRGSRSSADRCRAPAGAEGPRAGLVGAGEAPLADPMGESECPCRGGLPAVCAVGLPPACGGGMGPLGGAPPPEVGPMGKSGSGCWCAKYGLQRAGPRESARYGYRGVIIGEASHFGPVPTPADLSGAASSGEVLSYTRPTAGGGIGPTRGGGHR